MNTDQEKLQLRAHGFHPWEPEFPSKPDIPTVTKTQDSPEGIWTIQCANQCVRDENHRCGIDVDLWDIVENRWKGIVCSAIPWMIVQWGPHRHAVPFCCSTCLVQFVQERTARFEAVHSH